MSNLTGKTAIVTGGSKGFGMGIAAALKNAGADVYITGRDARALKATAARLGVHCVQADITCGGDWDRVITEATRGGRLDILVNNAGLGVKIAPLAQQSDDEIAASIAVNLTGAMLGCRRAAGIMSKQKSGTIINISSVCAQHAWPGWASYTAAKAGMIHFTRCLYTELRESGVRVTSLVPSWGATEFAVSANLPDKPADVRAKSIQPEEIGKVVVDLCLLPAHLAMQELTLLPLVQEIVPL